MRTSGARWWFRLAAAAAVALDGWLGRIAALTVRADPGTLM